MCYLPQAAAHTLALCSFRVSRKHQPLSSCLYKNLRGEGGQERAAQGITERTGSDFCTGSTTSPAASTICWVSPKSQVTPATTSPRGPVPRDVPRLPPGWQTPREGQAKNPCKTQPSAERGEQGEMPLQSKAGGGGRAEEEEERVSNNCISSWGSF